MVRTTCGVKLVDKRNTEELVDILGLKKAADTLARANSVRWYGHVLIEPEEDFLMKDGKHKVGQTKMKWREQVEGNTRRIGFRKDAADWCRSVVLTFAMFLYP